jgi:hypothetical protein
MRPQSVTQRSAKESAPLPGACRTSTGATYAGAKKGTWRDTISTRQHPKANTSQAGVRWRAVAASSAPPDAASSASGGAKRR